MKNPKQSDVYLEEYWIEQERIRKIKEAKEKAIRDAEEEARRLKLEAEAKARREKEAAEAKARKEAEEAAERKRIQDKINADKAKFKFNLDNDPVFKDTVKQLLNHEEHYENGATAVVFNGTNITFGDLKIWFSS